MRKIDLVVVHCSDTYAGQDIGAKEIDQWHRDRGFREIGYHYVIRRNGKIEYGRADNQIGAHCRGYNSRSVGICLVGGKGGFNFTRRQMWALDALANVLEDRYPGIDFLGHCDLDGYKDCPFFDVDEYLEG